MNEFIKLSLKVKMPENAMPVAADVSNIGEYHIRTYVHNSIVFDGGVEFTVLDVNYKTEDGHTGLLGQIFLEGKDRFDEADELTVAYVSQKNKDKNGFVKPFFDDYFDD